MKARIDRTEYCLYPRYWIWLEYGLGVLDHAYTLRGARRKARRMGKRARNPKRWEIDV